MLTWFRDKAKIFLIAIIVTFVVLIFVQWGTGQLNSRRNYSNAGVAIINGRTIPPEELNQSNMQVYNQMEEQMLLSGNPSPSAELTAMAEVIEETAWEQMIDSELESAYLRRLGWPETGTGEALALMTTQLTLMGVEDPEGYMEEMSAMPGFPAQVEQYVQMMRAAAFPAATRLQNMASRAELEYQIAANYMPITARYLVYSSTPPLPGEEDLRAFYDSHPELFTTPAYGVLRYVAVAVLPDSNDIQRTMGTVDSLAFAGTSPDTVVLTRENFLVFTMADTLPAVGERTRPFVSPSLRGGYLQSCHVVQVLGVKPEAGGEASLDTITMAHWEATVLPGMDALRWTQYAVVDSSAALLQGEIPWSDSLSIADWGTVTIEENSPMKAGLPPSMVAFALDTVWTDSIGPVFFSPSYQGGYPALIAAKRLESSPESVTMSYEEAATTGTLLITAYSAIQAESSLALAGREMARMRDMGLTLGAFAQVESLTLQTTPEFTASSVRQSSLSDPDAYGGLLCNLEFALDAMVAPIMTPMGPYRVGTAAVVAEVDTRTELPMPGDPAVLAPMYLSTQSRHSFSLIGDFLAMLRRDADVQDLREEYTAAMDSLRASQPQQQQQQVPIDY